MKTLRDRLFILLENWRSILLFETVILGIVGLIGVLSGWNTAADYTNALRLAGILTILLGLLSLYGGFESGRSLTYIVGSMSLPREALKKEPGYHQQSLSWFILCGIAGGMAILLSLLGAALLG